MLAFLQGAVTCFDGHLLFVCVIRCKYIVLCINSHRYSHFPHSGFYD